MTTERLYTTKEVARELDTYPRVVLAVVERYGVPSATAGEGRSFRLFSAQAIELIRPHVVEWQSRMRPGRKAATA